MKYDNMQREGKKKAFPLPKNAIDPENIFNH